MYSNGLPFEKENKISAYVYLYCNPKKWVSAVEFAASKANSEATSAVFESTMNEESFLTKGLYFIDHGEYQKAIDILSQHRDDMWCLFHEARALTYAGRFEEAIKNFERVMLLDWQEMSYENNPYFYVGMICFYKNDYILAKNMFLKALSEHYPEYIQYDANVFRWLGVTAHILGDWLCAINAYCTAIMLFNRLSCPVDLPQEKILLELCLQKKEIDIFVFESQICYLDVIPERLELLQKRIDANLETQPHLIAKGFPSNEQSIGTMDNRE